MFVHETVWKKMYAVALDPIIERTRILLNEKATVIRKYKCLCLIGGLSENQYCQTRMREEFGLKSEYKSSKTAKDFVVRLSGPRPKVS